MVRRVLPVLAALGLVVVAAAPASARNINATNAYAVHNLVSDNGAPGSIHDGNLVNGWGIVAGPTTPWWVADNGTDKSTLYTGAGAIVPIVVNVDSSGQVRSINGTTGSVDYARAGAAGASAFARAFNDVLATRDTPPVRSASCSSAPRAPASD